MASVSFSYQGIHYAINVPITADISKRTLPKGFQPIIVFHQNRMVSHYGTIGKAIFMPCAGDRLRTAFSACFTCVPLWDSWRNDRKRWLVMGFHAAPVPF
jgi:hypothetical protein